MIYVKSSASGQAKARAAAAAEAEKGEILSEQLRYLLMHSEGCAVPGCAQCARMATVESALMAAFGKAT